MPSKKRKNKQKVSLNQLDISIQNVLNQAMYLGAFAANLSEGHFLTEEEFKQQLKYSKDEK